MKSSRDEGEDWKRADDLSLVVELTGEGARACSADDSMVSGFIREVAMFGGCRSSLMSRELKVVLGTGVRLS